jgi:hypothetical protein
VIATARTSLREGRLTAIPTTIERPSPRVVLALARVEVRKLLLHPAFLGFCGVAGLGLLVVVGRDGAGLQRFAGVFVALAISVLGGTLLASNACALRARRDRMTELFGSLPVAAEARTAGILSAVLAGPVLIAVILAIVAYPLLRSLPDANADLELALMAQYPLTAAALGAIGVALARTIPSILAAPVVLVAHVMTGIVWLVPWIANRGSGIRMGWHYTYLLSIISLAVALSLARDGRRVLRWLAVGVASVLTVTAGFLQVPPGGLL